MRPDRAPVKSKTFEDLLVDGKRFFPSTYDKLLKIKDSGEQIDAIIKDIKGFVDGLTGKGEGLTTSQLRNIYARVKAAKSVDELKMKRPVLAYLAARQKRDEKSQVMISVFDDLIRQSNKDTLDGFKTFMESVVAYHRYFKEIKESDKKN